MNYIVEDTIPNGNMEDVLKAYYEFLEKLHHRNEIIPKKKRTNFNVNNLSRADKRDPYLQETIKVIKDTNENPEIRILCAYDEDNNLIALTRFRVNEEKSELLIADIVIVKKRISKDTINVVSLNYLENYAQKEGLQTVIVEIPLTDTSLEVTAEKLGYSFDASINGDLRRYTTMLLKKDVKNLEREDYGRRLVNKQTSKPNE